MNKSKKDKSQQFLIKTCVEKFNNSRNRILLLDYDGTLVNFSKTPDNVKPKEKLIKIIKKLNKKFKTKIIIITGRKKEDIENLIGHIQIEIIAEHGAFKKEKDKWKVQFIDKGIWKKNISYILEKIAKTCPNSFIEEKNFSLAWHYRKVKIQLGYKQSRKLIRILRKKNVVYNLKTLDGNKVIEIMSNKIGKGKSIEKLIRNKNYDYILSIGDDKTDEEMFEFLLNNKNAITIKVGKGKTFAKNRLKNSKEVILLLEELSKCD